MKTRLAESDGGAQPEEETSDMSNPSTNHMTMIELPATQYNQYAMAWRAGNAIGEGYPVGDESSDISDLRGDLGELIHESYSTGELAVYRSASGVIVAVGDANGPWAVTVGQAS